MTFDVLFRYFVMPSFMLFAIWGLFVSLRDAWRDFREGDAHEGMPRMSRALLRSGYRW